MSLSDEELSDINNRFDYHPPSTEEVRVTHEKVRANCRALAVIMTELVPSGREKSLVLTKIEEAMFWANAAIARNMNG